MSFNSVRARVCPLISQEEIEELIGGCFEWPDMPPAWQGFCGRLATQLCVDPVVILATLIPVFGYLMGPTSVQDRGRGYSVGWRLRVVALTLLFD